MRSPATLDRCGFAITVVLLALWPTALRADGKVEHRTKTVRTSPDPEVARAIRFLAGDSAAFARQGRRERSALRRPPWLEDWRRRMQAALAAPATAPAHALAGIAGRVRALVPHTAGREVDEVMPNLTWLACQDGGARPDVRPGLTVELLDVDALGTHRVKVALYCQTAKQSRRARILVTTDGRGEVQALLGLALVGVRAKAPTSRHPQAAQQMQAWPLKPANLRRNFNWLEPLNGNGWLAQLTWTPMRVGPAPPAMATVGPMPFASAAADSDRLRAVLRFDADGAPVQVLFVGTIPLMKAERGAAGRRQSGEDRLPAVRPALAPAPLPEIGLWRVFQPVADGRQAFAKAPMIWLQQVAIRSEQGMLGEVFGGAGYAAWRVDGAGRMLRVATLLPRTAGEGIWGCLWTANDAVYLDCRFDAGSLPDARTFAPRKLHFSATGQLAAKGSQR